ncbi:MAG: hypothetical protein ACK5Q5_10845 [Planctomycetaceae bacterium]
MWAYLQTASLMLLLVSSLQAAEPTALPTRWTQLWRAGRPLPQPRPLPENGAIQSIGELQLTGPMPAHPFVLGNFAVDGQFGIVNGGLELMSGRSAAIQLVERADQFELEGQIAMKDNGGWFLLLGWNADTGNGYVVHNCMMKQSGSPWFITEMRGHAAVEGTNQEVKQLEWRRLQEIKVAVRESQLNVQLGALKVIDQAALPNYQPGAIVFGVYDTKYGPRPVHINALRIRGVEPMAANATERPASTPGSP